MIRPLVAILALLPLVGPRSVFAQSSHVEGLPFFECTSPSEADGANQIWDITQDDRGVIFFASLGATEYDGAFWRLVRNDGYSTVRSHEPGTDGRVYTGGAGEFGYLAPDSVGRRRHHSLLPFVPEEHREFNDVWTVDVTPDGVYFLAREKLFLATPSGDAWSIRTWAPSERFLYGFFHDGVYYVHQQGVGFSRMDEGRIVPMPGGSQFGNDRLQVMLPHPELAGGFVLGTFNRGLFKYDGRAFSPWVTEADAYLKENTLYKGVVLPDGSFALTTLSGGVLLLRRDGTVRAILNAASGLPGDDVLSAFVDRSGLLWVGPKGWLCQVDVLSPLTRFDKTLGIDGDISVIHRHRGTLYVGTQNAVHYLDVNSGRLHRVTGFAPGVAQTWSLLSVGEDLLVATGSGIYQIHGSRAVPIVLSEGGVAFTPLALIRSKQDPNRVFVGLDEGLASVYRDDSRGWHDEGRIEGISVNVYHLAEREPGEIWLGVQGRGVVRLQMSGDRRVLSQEMYGKDRGPKVTNGVGLFRDDLIVADIDRILRFNATSGEFEVDSLLTTLIGPAITDSWWIEEHTDNVTYVALGAASAALHHRDDGSIDVDSKPFLRFADEPVATIHADEDGVVWLGTDEALIRYDPRVPKSYAEAFPVLLRHVSTHSGEIFGGEGALAKGYRLPYAENSIRFEYAAAVYDRPSTTTFQTRLEGFDGAWADWSSELRREYTNLPPGDYTFRVRGRNIYEQLGTEAAFAFTILPPWYRSAWAYLGYGLLFGGLVFATDRVQRRRLTRKERERAAVEQAELRAVAAEAQSKALRAENDRKKNIELLSRIGRDITSTLSIEQIIDTVYEHVNALMDASVFGIGLYNEAENRLEFPATKERGETLPFFVNSCDDPSRFAVWCINNKKELVIQNVREEWSSYVDRFEGAIEGDDTVSIIYLPLIHNEKRIGVITAQSFETNAYTEDHLNILRNLATYTAIAVDNADAYRRLHATVQELHAALDDLKRTQEQLVTQEKMASLGALTAGIAHEVKNPLNFVNNFAELVIELTDELRTTISANHDRRIGDLVEELDEIALSLRSNARQISKHGRRADDIVRGMMQHASGGAGERYEVAVNGLVEEYVNLAYHGMRARPDSFNIELAKELDPDVGHVTMAPQEIGRVLVNLMNNAFDAVRERGAGKNGQGQPRVTVRTRRCEDRVVIEVEDNGPGVPAHVREKIFEPFFTTKPPGSGTGLGLSLSYDIIVRGHGGDLAVENLDAGGARFAVTLRA